MADVVRRCREVALVARRCLATADHTLLRAVELRRRPSLDRALAGLSRAADHGVLWMGISVVVASIGGHKGRRAAFRGLAAQAATSAIVNLPAKRLMQRTRPTAGPVAPTDPLRPLPASFSFPSGHTASAFAYATGAAIESRALAVPLGAVAITVGISRVYVGVHYPTDVLAGAAIGLAVGLASASLAPRRVEASLLSDER